MPVPTVKPLGIGDLKVVKQRLARYEASEVSHIENVLASEKRDRQHRRLRQIEETVTVEESREEESLRDVQSTERFEMQTESQRTQKSDTTFQAGLDLSATYGMVSLTASAKFGMTSSKEDSDKQSTKYAKDVTDRTLSRIVEKVRGQRTTRILEETEEKNQHAFDNTGLMSSNISGIYRWVDKYYRCKVVDYGKRLFYEFVIPEPAAFYLFATLYNLNSKVLPEKPQAPTKPGSNTPLAPGDITRTNYLKLLKQYGAEGVDPPPPSELVVTKAIARELNPGAMWAFSNDDLKVPKGYQADWGIYVVEWTYMDNVSPYFGLQVGLSRIEPGNYPSLVLLGEADSIPISADGYALNALAANIEVSCRLMSDAFERWQVKTYSAIMTGYRRAVMDYEDKVAAAQVNPNAQLGTNPAINREVERRELKKLCIELWSTLQLGNISGVSVNPGLPIPGNYPDINAAGAAALEAPARFFEEAFEWSNMAFELYPYYWGRRSVWADTYSLQSTDPLFENFLKAGAARVVVPVKPSFTDDVLYYQLSGVIWSGGPVPSLSTFTDPEAALYNSYLEEMEGIPDIPDIDKDVPIDSTDPDSWLIKVPTDLVWLQSDKDLPDMEN